MLREAPDPKPRALRVCQDVRVARGRNRQLLADVRKHVVAHALDELFEAKNAKEPAHVDIQQLVLAHEAFKRICTCLSQCAHRERVAAAAGDGKAMHDDNNRQELSYDY